MSLPPSPTPVGTGFCDHGMDPPCLHGLSTWIWVVLILGAVLLTGFWIWCCWRQHRQGVTPSKGLNFLEAVLSAAHSDPDQSRLHGRASTKHPRLDLFEAQECCCFFPLSLGLTLLGMVDLARLGYVIAYAGDSSTQALAPSVIVVVPWLTHLSSISVHSRNLPANGHREVPRRRGRLCPPDGAARARGCRGLPLAFAHHLWHQGRALVPLHPNALLPAAAPTACFAAMASGRSHSHRHLRSEQRQLCAGASRVLRSHRILLARARGHQSSERPQRQAPCLHGLSAPHTAC